MKYAGKVVLAVLAVVFIHSLTPLPPSPRFTYISGNLMFDQKTAMYCDARFGQEYWPDEAPTTSSTEPIPPGVTFDPSTAVPIQPWTHTATGQQTASNGTSGVTFDPSTFVPNQASGSATNPTSGQSGSTGQQTASNGASGVTFDPSTAVPILIEVVSCNSLKHWWEKM